MNRHISFAALLLPLVTLVSAASTVGCASLREPTPPGFQKIALQAQVARDEYGKLAGDLNAYSDSDAAILGAAIAAPIGAIVGGFAGIGIGYLACKDSLDAIVCIPLGAGAGTIGGGVLGLVGGAAVGVLGGLPKETAEQVTAQLKALEFGRHFEDDLLAALKAAVPPAKQVDAAHAEATVIAQLVNFDLRQHSGDRISVRVDATMVQMWKGPGGEPQQKTCEYRFTSEKRQAAEWVLDNGAAFEATLTQAMQTFARWMARDLEAFAARTELRWTDTEPASCFRG